MGFGPGAGFLEAELSIGGGVGDDVESRCLMIAVDARRVSRLVTK